MKLEMTFKFDRNKYFQTVNKSENSNIFDGSRIFYNYIDKVGIESRVEIMFKSVKIDNFLCNEIISRVDDISDLYAKINFLNYEEYINFVLPNWLANFKF